MKNQKGFTLVELMVVMAIIAILSTAGISQYGRFIKSARDTTRTSDLNALNVVILDSIQSNGTVPGSAADFITKIKEVAGKDVVDPLNGSTACLEGDGETTIECGYKYAICDGGTGYKIATSFESKNNVDNKYKKDDVSTSDDTHLSDDLYELGNCNVVDIEYEPISA
jgi:prepilin-type N-terminal cleavage/methylation domain-containing protein